MSLQVTTVRRVYKLHNLDEFTSYNIKMNLQVTAVR
jgi:hypothetical protein